jgi:hypothetical protein
LTAAAALFRSQAARLLLIGLLLQVLGGLAQVGIFALLFVLAVPALTAGVLQAMHEAASGQRPAPLVLFAAFRNSGKLLSLVLLGAITIGATLLVLSLLVAGTLAGLDPELVARIQAGDQAAVMELDPALVQKVVLGMLAGLLTGALLGFFAVPLIWFDGRPLGNALWAGLSMLFRQWRALTAMGLGLAVIGLPVGLLAGMIVAAQASGAAPSLLLTALLMGVVVLYQVLAFAAQYVAYRDAFHGASPPPPTDPGSSEAEDQLVA